VEKNIQTLAQHDPLVSASLPSRHTTPVETEKPLPTELSMDEIRRQNDVERWRNKLRLQEKFQVITIYFFFKTKKSMIISILFFL